MSYRKLVQDCLDYIEENLTAELTPQSLAAYFGYSLYHFCYVFKTCLEMPVGEYVRWRRMQVAAEELRSGKKVSDTGWDLGFETVSGFYRAFKKQYGLTPKKYQILYKGCVFMQVQVMQKAAFKAVGYTFYPPECKDKVHNHNLEGAYWLDQDFSNIDSKEYAKLADRKAEIGLWLHPQDNGNLFYFFGAIVDDFDFIPAGAEKIEIPAAEYAVFTTNPVNLAEDKAAFAQAIRKTWKQIFLEWFETSEYKWDESKIAFEYYGLENGSLKSTAATAQIFVPVLKK